MFTLRRAGEYGGGMDDRTSELERRAYERIVLELTARTWMMVVHGVILILVGLTMSVTGSPAPIEAAWGPWSRTLIGGAAMVIGSIILVGAARTDNDGAGWKALLAGFGAGMLWHLGLSAAYAVAAIRAEMAILMPGEILDASVTNRGYIPLIYLGYVLLTGIHLRTVWKLGPPPR